MFRIPSNQLWDEGVGYDFADLIYEIKNDKNYSVRPSNWFQTTTIDNWTQPGIYNNENNGVVNYNDLVIVDTQHFVCQFSHWQRLGLWLSLKIDKDLLVQTGILILIKLYLSYI